MESTDGSRAEDTNGAEGVTDEVGDAARTHVTEDQVGALGLEITPTHVADRFIRTIKDRAVRSSG